MPAVSKKYQSSFYPVKYFLTAVFLLFVFSTGILIPTISAVNEIVPDGMVYCPLTHKFQPISSEKYQSKIIPFEDICASDSTKQFLIEEVLIKNLLKKVNNVSLDKNGLDKLAFDFLKDGQAAFEQLPQSPKFPSKHLVKQISSSIFADNNYKLALVWKQTVENFLINFQSRPPTLKRSVFDSLDSIYHAPNIARHLAPRAPPRFFS